MSDLFGYDKTVEGNVVIYKIPLSGYNKDLIELTAEGHIVNIKLTEGKYKGSYKLYVKKGYTEIRASCIDGLLTIKVIYPEPTKIEITFE
jgi:HSP20 family molecular chaperone IbpA